jgi:hypothetical protein
MSQIRAKQILSNNTGDLLVGNNTNFGILSVGTLGQVLTVNGGTAVWASPVVPDAFIYEGTVNAANDLLPQVSATPEAGYYYAVTATGNTENFNGTWDANSSPPFVGATFLPGDAIVYNGSTWDKFENNNTVVTGTTNEIDVSFNNLNNTYTVSMDPNYAGQSSITTVGTITSGTWNATPVGRQFGGTGSNTSTIGANRILIATSTTTTGGIVAPTVANTFLEWNGTAFVWATATVNAYGFINGNSGSSSASGEDTLDIVGTLGITTVAADGSPDSLTISTSINTGSALYNNVGAGSVQLGIQGPTVGTLLQANGASSEATWTTYTLPTSVGAAGTFLQSDGTNIVTSTVVLPTSASAPGALVVNSNNTVTDTMAATAGQVLFYNGTTVGFAALPYSDLTGTPTDGENETVVVTPSANQTFTGFFSNTPIAGSISVFFNGLRLRDSGWSVAGLNLSLVDSVNGYTTDVNDVIAAIYQY